MPNFDGVYELRLIYTTEPTGFLPLEHRHTLDIAIPELVTPGTPFSDIAPQARSGGFPQLNEWCDQYTALLEEIFAPTTDFGRYELWRIPEGTFDATYVSTYEVGTSGAAGVASVPAAQMTLTFRTIGGGHGRCQLMETYDGGSSKLSPPYAAGGFKDVATFLTSADTIVQGRDNTYFFANIHWCSGQNEKLWRKRFRS